MKWLSEIIWDSGNIPWTLKRNITNHFRQMSVNVCKYLNDNARCCQTLDTWISTIWLWSCAKVCISCRSGKLVQNGYLVLTTTPDPHPPRGWNTLSAWVDALERLQQAADRLADLRRSGLLTQVAGHSFFDNAVFENAFFENFANFWRACSRLYQNEILQENMRLTAFSRSTRFASFCTAAISKFSQKNLFEKTAIFVKFQHKICKCRKICKILSNFKNFSLRVW